MAGAMDEADWLIVNGRVFTSDVTAVESSGAPNMVAVHDTVAVRGAKIVYVGNGAGAQSWVGPRTRSIDAQGCTVMPGLIDSHFHLFGGAQKLGKLDLSQVTTPDEVVDAVRVYAQANPALGWITGHHLRYGALNDEQAVWRDLLDNCVADRPCYLEAYDCHTVWANSQALELAGLAEMMTTPAGSEIVRDPATGRSTGELREPGAFQPLLDLEPQPDSAISRLLVQRALAQLARFGITGIHNMDGDAAQIALYAEMVDAGEFTVRIHLPYSLTPEMPLPALAEAADWPTRYGRELITTGAIKLFMDGVLESYTGLLVEPYADAPEQGVGRALFSSELFNEWAQAADALGLQVIVHACGDGAVRRALDGFAAARQVNGTRDSRHRIEHVELIHPAELPRFAELGVTAAMQPLHAPFVEDGDVWPLRVGEARWRWAFAWNDLRGAGARLVFGSDWPVVTMDPWAAIQAAVTRQPWRAGLPEQRQTLVETLLGYTGAAATAAFWETRVGALRPGLAADLLVLDVDLFSVPLDEIWRVRPRLTMSNGRMVHANRVKKNADF